MRARTAAAVATFLALAVLPGAADGGWKIKPGKTRAVTVPDGGPSAAQHFSRFPAISDHGRYLAFMTDVPELIGANPNGISQIVVLDRKLGTTSLVTERKFGGPTTEYPAFPVRITGDGHYVVFYTEATDLVDGFDLIDDNDGHDVFRTHVETGDTVRVSQTHDFKLADKGCFLPAVSADGRFVVYQSLATNLVPGTAPSFTQIYVRDMSANTVERVSVSPIGEPADSSCHISKMSADGRFVVYSSSADNLSEHDTDFTPQIWLRDRDLGVNELISVSDSGQAANGTCEFPVISGAGRYVAYRTTATNLPGAPQEFSLELYVRDRKKGKSHRLKVKGESVHYAQAESFSAGRYLTATVHYHDMKPARAVVFDVKKLKMTHVGVASDGKKGNADTIDAVISGDGKTVAFASKATNLGKDGDAFLDVFVRRWKK